MKKSNIIIGLLLSVNAYADAFVSYGFGLFHSAKNSVVETKNASLGYRGGIFKNLHHKVELGGWTDTRKDLGRNGAGYGFYSLGVYVDADNFYGYSFVGAGGVTRTDSMLGGHFQFSEDVGIGIKDKRGVSIGLNYKHISSAGIYNPNQGRDFLQLSLGVLF